MNRFFRPSLFIISIFATLSLYADIEQANPIRFSELIATENTLLIDVRTPAEAKEARIKNSIVIDFYSELFAEKIQELPKDKILLLYCRSGNRSGKTAVFLESKGYQNLVNLAGGINAWKIEALPVDKQ